MDNLVDLDAIASGQLLSGDIMEDLDYCRTHFLGTCTCMCEHIFIEIQ